MHQHNETLDATMQSQLSNQIKKKNTTREEDERRSEADPNSHSSVEYL